VAVDEGLGTDRLLGRDEVGDDGTQYLEATIVGAAHVFTHPFHCRLIELDFILRSSAARIPRQRLAARPTAGCG
jgi:hypothetical protein